LDGPQHALRFPQVRGQGLLDHQVQPALHGRQDGVHVRVLVGGDDGRRGLGAPHQLPVVGGQEVGADVHGELLAPVRVQLGDPDPLHVGMPGGQLAPDPAHAPRPDDGQTDALVAALAHAVLFSM